MRDGRPRSPAGLHDAAICTGRAPAAGRLDSLRILEYTSSRCVLLADAAHEGGSYRLHQRSIFPAWPIGSRTWAAPNTRISQLCGDAAFAAARRFTLPAVDKGSYGGM